MATGEYNATGWAAGCGTAGLCGTYSDGTGSGVSQVQVSIRQGAGNYWNGTSFASAAEVWNTTTIGGGNWSYGFAAGSFPADGSYTVRVRAVDAVANTETPSTRTFTYDATNPSALFTFPASGGNYTTTTWNAGCGTNGFCGTHTDALSGVQAVQVSILRVSTGLYWNGTSFASGTESFQTASLAGGNWSLTFPAASFPADGQYTVHVRARDDAQNTETGPSRTFRIDNTAPASTVTFPASAGTYNTAGWNAGCATNGFCGTHSDAGSGVQGVQVSIRQGAGNYWNGTSFASGTEVWNTATLAGGNWSLTFPAASFPADGSYTVRVRATDVAGNVETPSTRTFTIDRAAPQTTIDSNPTNPSGSNAATFTFSSSEGGSTFECRIDGGAWGACTSPRNYTSLTDGSHTFDVRATDVAGNTDASPASYTWLVDTTAPSSTVTFPANSGTYNTAGWNAGCGTNGLCGTYGDGSGSGVSQVQVSIRQGAGNYWNGTSFASATEVWNTATLAGGNWSLTFPAASFPADGSYTVRVRAVDAVANTETPSNRTFTIDRTAPQTTIDSNPASQTSSTSAGLHVLLERGQLHLRVPHRRRRLGRLHQPAQLHQPRRRQPHLRRARHRRRRQHRRLARLLHLARRHDGPDLDDGLPGRLGQLHGRRVDGRLRARRSLRHLRRRRRRGRRLGRGLHPPRHRQLLERHELRQRDRGLEHGDPRGRQLVARLRGGQLPGRRELHRARPRDGCRRQRREPLEPDVRGRPDRSVHHGLLPRRRRHVQRGRLGRGLRHRGPLRHVHRRDVGRRLGRGLDPPRLRQLLERLRLLERERGLEHGDPRRRELVLRVRRRQLPGRRRLHGARARERRRRQRRGPLEPDLHVRHDGAADDDRLQPERPRADRTAPPSTSPRARGARRSSAASTAAPGAPAPARRATRA